MTTWACVCRFGGIGDNLLATAALPALKRRYDRVEVITQMPQGVVFENSPYIDKLTMFRDGELGTLHNDPPKQRWFELRAKEYDLFVNLTHSMEMRTVVFPDSPDFWSVPEFRRKYYGHSHLQVVADKCGVPVEELEISFFPTEKEDAKAAETRRRYFSESRVTGVVLTGSRMDKVYPYLPTVVERLIGEVGPVLLLGGPDQQDHTLRDAIETHVKNRRRSLDGLVVAMSPSRDNQIWSIRRVLTQAQHCDVLLGPDTGTMWSVAHHDMPKVLLLSHDGLGNMAHWRNTTILHADQDRVPCWPCHRLIDSMTQCTPNAEGNGAACISDIAPHEVVEAVRRAHGRITGIIGPVHTFPMAAE